MTDLLPPVTYSLRRLARSRLRGCTQPVSGALDVIVKFDGDEAPFCTCNELVAVRLAQIIRAPIADGVLIAIGGRHAFASLRVGGRGWTSPTLGERQWPAVARRYPQAAANLMAFDILVGNTDRVENFSASLVTPHLRHFLGYDHSHSLLCCRATARKSLAALRQGELIATSHPFYQLVSWDLLEAGIGRITQIPDSYIVECCDLGQPLGAATEKIQRALGRALVLRKNRLRAIVAENMATIQPNGV